MSVASAAVIVFLNAWNLSNVLASTIIDTHTHTHTHAHTHTHTHTHTYAHAHTHAHAHARTCILKSL